MVFGNSWRIDSLCTSTLTDSHHRSGENPDAKSGCEYSGHPKDYHESRHPEASDPHGHCGGHLNPHDGQGPKEEKEGGVPCHGHQADGLARRILSLKDWAKELSEVIELLIHCGVEGLLLDVEGVLLSQPIMTFFDGFLKLGQMSTIGHGCRSKEEKMKRGKKKLWQKSWKKKKRWLIPTVRVSDVMQGKSKQKWKKCKVEDDESG
jgi:hypothetical protein